MSAATAELPSLRGLSPVGVRCTAGGAHLRWRIGREVVETGFDRFVPVQLQTVPGSRDLLVEWRDVDGLAFTEPFFRGTLEKAARLPDASAPFETDWEVARQVAQQPGTLPFSGAIFHMARTGSTLVHRLLNETERVLSLSEPGIIDRALVLTAAWPEAERRAVLQDLVRALARPRRTGESHLVIKMSDGVPNAEHPCLHAAFPDLPWIFLYRDPAEVMVSLLGRPTDNIRLWLSKPRFVAERLGMPELADQGLPVAEVIARSLRRFCLSAVEIARASRPGRFLAVSYTRLPEAVWETVAPHFGLSLSPQDRERMRRQSRYSGSRRGMVEFTPDRESKRERVTPEIAALAEKWIAPVIDQLKALPQG